MNRIKEIREAKGKTQEWLSQQTGFHESTISDHENGKKLLREDSIRKYASALEVTADQIMGMEKEK